MWQTLYNFLLLLLYLIEYKASLIIKPLFYVPKKHCQLNHAFLPLVVFYFSPNERAFSVLHRDFFFSLWGYFSFAL